MIVNFRVREISWGARKLARTLVLIKKKRNWSNQSIHEKTLFIFLHVIEVLFLGAEIAAKMPRSFFPSLLNSDPFWTLNSASIWSWTYWVWSPNCFWMPSIETCSEFCRCWSCSSIRWMINRGIKAPKWFWYQIC